MSTWPAAWRACPKGAQPVEPRDVAGRQELLLNAIDQLAVEHGREDQGHCAECGKPYPCITIKRVASVWANDAAFDEALAIDSTVADRHYLRA